MKLHLVVYSDYDIHSIESAWFNREAAEAHLSAARKNKDDFFRKHLELEEVETSDDPDRPVL